MNTMVHKLTEPLVIEEPKIEAEDFRVREGKVEVCIRIGHL